MFQEIQKELIATATEGFKKLIQNGMRFAILVISCWMGLGILGIGIFVPVYVFQVVTAPKEIKTIQGMDSRPEPFRRNVREEKANPAITYQEPGTLQPRMSVRKDMNGTDLRRGLSETRSVIQELRRLGNGLSGFTRN